MTTYHPVTCLDATDVAYVIKLCICEGYSYRVRGLIVTFWRP
jgi:hypothetical protein